MIFSDPHLGAAERFESFFPAFEHFLGFLYLDFFWVLFCVSVCVCFSCGCWRRCGFCDSFVGLVFKFWVLLLFAHGNLVHLSI
jgi:hypothetical protein